MVGHSEHMVCEACELVDTFLDLSPDVAVVLNIDEDHLDYFKTQSIRKIYMTKARLPLILAASPAAREPQAAILTFFLSLKLTAAKGLNSASI